jgi:hypothetical protein
METASATAVEEEWYQPQETEDEAVRSPRRWSYFVKTVIGVIAAVTIVFGFQVAIITGLDRGTTAAMNQQFGNRAVAHAPAKTPTKQM